jgi:hypothetical protein
MIKEALIIVVSTLLLALVTGLFLAWPVRLTLAKLFNQRVSFWKTFLLVFIIDTSGHLAGMLFFLFQGRLRPTVTNDPVSWIVNAITLIVAGRLILARALRTQGGSKPALSPCMLATGITASIILARDAVLVLFFLQILRNVI